MYVCMWRHFCFFFSSKRCGSNNAYAIDSNPIQKNSLLSLLLAERINREAGLWKPSFLSLYSCAIVWNAMQLATCWHYKCHPNIPCCFGSRNTPMIIPQLCVIKNPKCSNIKHFQPQGNHPFNKDSDDMRTYGGVKEDPLIVRKIRVRLA